MRALIRKYKLSGLAIISLLGLVSIFSVNLAGFLVLLPKPLWGLLDAEFVTSYFLRLSILLALAVLASRYSVYIASQFLGIILMPCVLLSLVRRTSGRRLIRIRGHRAVSEVSDMFSELSDMFVVPRDNDSYSTGHRGSFEIPPKVIYKSDTARAIYGVSYILGVARGRIEFRIENFAIPLQLLVVILVLSTLYTTTLGSILLVLLGIFLFTFIPPTPSEAFYEKRYYLRGIPFPRILSAISRHMVNLHKLTLLALTISFASGILHHKSLLLERAPLRFTGTSNSSGALISATSSGFIIGISEKPSVSSVM